jgi:hypothetical protein
MTTPLTYEKPERRRDRANSHFCDVVGSTVWCTAYDCPHDCTETEGGDSQ